MDKIQEKIGSLCSWLSLVMVAVTFLVVVLRYVFQVGWVWMQEIVTYSHAILFLTASGYTLLKNGHVRVDIFYRGASKLKQAWVDLIGTLFLLFPTCFLIFYLSYPYVRNSWKVFEGSKDGGGLEGVFILKTFLLIFCALLIFQGFSVIRKSFLTIKGGARG